MSDTNTDRPADEHYNAPLRPHEFDGIREFDNKLPQWWLWTFFGAIIFSFFYWFHYEVLHTGPGQLQAYEMEIEKAEKLRDELIASSMDLTDDGLIKLSQDPEVVARGKGVFASTCIACHKADGSGSIGPNLTDNSWLHGGKPIQIFTVIDKGVTGTQMQAWGPPFGPKRVADVTAFLITIKGTNLPGKAAEGTPESGN